MKRITAFALTLVMVLTLFAGCSGTTELPETVDELLDLGEQYLLDKDYEQALLCFQKIIEIDPKNPRGYTGAAEALVGLDRKADAIELLVGGLEATDNDESIMQMLLGLGWEPEPTPTPVPTPTPEPTPTPHVHDWKEANYQEPKICLDCQETEGEPLPNGLDQLGYTMLDFDTPYDYLAMCSDDTTQSTIGKVTLSDLRIIESDDTYEPREGFEWRIIRVRIEFGEEKVRTYGATWGFVTGDSYGFSPENEVTSGGESTINYLGVEYDISSAEGGDDKRTELQSGWVGSVYVFEYEVGFRRPIGYDGAYLYFYNRKNRNAEEEQPASELIDDDTLWFRIK